MVQLSAPSGMRLGDLKRGEMTKIMEVTTFGSISRTKQHRGLGLGMDGALTKDACYGKHKLR